MTDEDILPLDGGDFQDDPALKSRLAKAYHATPPSDESTITRCVRLVLERAAHEHGLPAVARQTTRRWTIIGAAAVAAGLLAAVTLRSRGPSDPNSESLSSAPVATTTAIEGGIRFELRLPKNLAANVSVIGDFNGWDGKATPMVKDAKSGDWSAKIALLPGRHIYAYLVNGEKWIVDPLKPQIPDAGYGPANALVVEEASK